ncbi:MAG: hypothetical protein AAFV49_08910 [Pseudomonadota bacterium]
MIKLANLPLVDVKGDSMRNEHLAAFGVLAFGVVLLLLNFYFNRYFYHDDAYISLRYALNLVNHGDLSWNVGDRVEGYTNFLHLTSAAGLIALGFEPVLATQVINILGAVLLVGAVVVGANMAAPGQENALPRAVAITAALAAEGMAAWVLGGLEAVLAAGLVGAAIACLVPLFRSGWPERIDLPALAGLFFAMAYLTRPDSVVMNAAAGFAVLGLGAAALRTRIRQFLVIGIIPFTVLVLHMAWRLDYYGDYLPNTFFAKVGVDVGTRLAMVPFYFAKSFAKKVLGR